MIPNRFFFGLDLGQAADYTALAIIERQARERREDTALFHCRHLQRWPLRTPYPRIVEDVAQMLRSEEMWRSYEEPVLAVDGTGVGPPVIDLFRGAFNYSGPFQFTLGLIDLDTGAYERIRSRRERRKEVYLMPIVITGGDTVTRDKHATRVPKRDLVSVTQVALQTDRLKIARGLDHATTLTNELMNFRVKISLGAGDDAAGDWREGAHDDLVLAVCLALWSSENLREVTVTDEERAIFEELANYTGR